MVINYTFVWNLWIVWKVWIVVGLLGRYCGAKPIPLERRNRKVFGFEGQSKSIPWSSVVNGRGNLFSDLTVSSIQNHTISKTRKDPTSLFECDRDLFSLAAKFFAPFSILSSAAFPPSKHSTSNTTTLLSMSSDIEITSKAVMDNFRPRLDKNFLHELGHVVVRNGTVILNDQSKANWWYYFETTRRDFVLELLKRTVERFTLPDFEFAMGVHDCPPMWKARVGPEFPEYGTKSLDYWKGLARFHITRCDGYNTIPLVQWFHQRDGDFDKWDENVEEMYRIVQKTPWERRIEKGIFRGSFQPWSSFDIDGKAKLTLIDRNNWPLLGRTKLRMLAQKRPDLLDVRIIKVLDFPAIFHEYPFKKENGDYMNLVEQVRQYKYQIVVEGHCGWADRLRVLLHLGTVVLLQETYCHEWFKFLLVPYVHYIPVDGTLKNLVEQIEWAREHDGKVREIAENARRFAQKFLTQKSITCWNDIIFTKYAELYKEI